MAPLHRSFCQLAVRYQLMQGTVVAGLKQNINIALILPESIESEECGWGIDAESFQVSDLIDRLFDLPLVLCSVWDCFEKKLFPCVLIAICRP